MSNRVYNPKHLTCLLCQITSVYIKYKYQPLFLNVLTALNRFNKVIDNCALWEEFNPINDGGDESDCDSDSDTLDIVNDDDNSHDAPTIPIRRCNYGLCDFKQILFNTNI